MWPQILSQNVVSKGGGVKWEGRRMTQENVGLSAKVKSSIRNKFRKITLSF